MLKSWKLEKEKSKTLFQKHNDWKNYFVLPDFLSGITYKTALSYRSIYKKTNFERFINFIPENYKYHIILYCGVGGYYNLTSKTVYIGINPETTCANFYNTLYHEQCHIDYGKYIKNMPHEFQELVIDAITYKKYGIQLLKQGMSIKGLTNEEILYKDFKSYKVDNDMIGIGQVLTSDYDLININEMVDYLDYVAEKSNYKVLTLFVTDIFNHISHCLYNRNSERIIKNSFDVENIYEGFELKNVLSRKVQIAPYIMDTVDKDN